MSKRSVLTLDRRELLTWIARTSAAAAGVHWLAACGDGAAEVPDASPLADASGDSTTAMCAATTPDVLGPYYRPGAPSRMTIASPTEAGERLVLAGAVVGPDCRPLAGATLDFWQADKDGRYYEPTGPEPFRLRGKLQAGADGSWELHTIKPGNYMLSATLWRPAHIHVTVTHPGYRSVTTQLYFEGDPFLPPNDGCTTCGSDDPARIMRITAGRADMQLALARA